MTTIKAHFDGKTIVPDEPIYLPVDQPLTIHIDSKIAPENSITGKQLAESDAFGIWKDRTDIGDSVEYARKLRKQGETRHHEIDDPA